MMPGTKSSPQVNRAIRVTRSWLRSCGIPFTETPVGIWVEGPTRVLVTIDPSPGCASNKCGPTAYASIGAPDITSADLRHALRTFSTITKLAGITCTPPTRGIFDGREMGTRGTLNPAKILRHKEFRRSPDLPPEKWSQYASVVRRSCSNFFRRNYYLCSLYGLERRDLETYAWIYVHSFVHEYERAPHEEEPGENKRMCFRHIKVRFTTLCDELHRARQSACPDREIYAIALYGIGYVTAEDHCVSSPDDDASADDIDNQEQTVKLRQQLRKLPCASIRSLYVEQTQNSDPEIAAAARKALDRHYRRCGCASQTSEKTTSVE